jgi:hypothetical protein
MFALLALAISLFGTQCWAQEGNCSGGEGVVSCKFSPGITEGIYDFSGDGKLTVDFVKVLTTFTLTVTVDHNMDDLAPGVFPDGTLCVPYSTNGGQCVEYDFTGNAGVPKNGVLPNNGVPVKGVDFTNLINLTLSYLNYYRVHKPAFLHAPGDKPNPLYREDFLTAYSALPPCPVDGCGVDPTMNGQLPGLSTVAAFDEPGGTDCFNFVSPTPGQMFHVGHEIEVEFQLFDNTACNGDPIRDKDARLSLSMTDSNGNISFPPLRNKGEGNKFHFDHEDGVNELDLSTEGLAPGQYTITVFSDEFSPHSVYFILIPGKDPD